jgi:hypothetical protein
MKRHAFVVIIAASLEMVTSSSPAAFFCLDNKFAPRGESCCTTDVHKRRRRRLSQQHWSNSNSEESGSTVELKVESGKVRLAQATAALIAKRKQEINGLGNNPEAVRESVNAVVKRARQMKRRSSNLNNADSSSTSDNNDHESDLIDLTRKIDQKILSNNVNKARMRVDSNNKQQHRTIDNLPIRHDNSMQSLLGYNEIQGEWSDRNSTTYHVAIVFAKPLIRDCVTIEYSSRLRTLVKMLRHDEDSSEENYRPRLICFVNGCSGVGGGGAGVDNNHRGNKNAVSDACAGYIYFRHLCASQNVTIDDSRTEFWVDNSSSDNNSEGGGDERSAMERVASELWRRHIKSWLKDRPLTQRLNQHYGRSGWTVLERRVDIHFTLVSTDYHLCNLNDVHNRSPRKSFLQPLVALRGLVGSDRWVTQADALEVMDPGYSTSVHVQKNDNGGGVVPPSNNFGGIENSVDTSWSFQYSTYPFLSDEEEAVVFLGQCYLLGEELTPLLVNMRGVVERTEFFQRDNYLLLSSIRRSLVILIEELYTDKGQQIRAGVIRYFEESRGRNQFTKEDVKIIVVLESALLNLGRCLDLVKPAGLLVSSVPAATWSKALFNLEESMSRIKTVCDPDQILNAAEWGNLFE